MFERCDQALADWRVLSRALLALDLHRTWTLESWLLVADEWYIVDLVPHVVPIRFDMVLAEQFLATCVEEGPKISSEALGNRRRTCFSSAAGH